MYIYIYIRMFIHIHTQAAQEALQRDTYAQQEGLEKKLQDIAAKLFTVRLETYICKLMYVCAFMFIHIHKCLYT